MLRLIPVLSLAFILAACSSQPPAPEQAPSTVGDVSGRPVTTTTTPITTDDGLGRGELTAPGSKLAKREIFFDLDSYVIREEFKPLVESHAKFLTRYPKQKVLVQGNTDDRGSREYNLALGQKRAEAVKKALTLLGAREEQVEAVSLGKEKQRCTESNEDCWAQNRRADLIYSHEL